MIFPLCIIISWFYAKKLLNIFLTYFLYETEKSKKKKKWRVTTIKEKVSKVFPLLFFIIHKTEQKCRKSCEGQVIERCWLQNSPALVWSFIYLLRQLTVILSDFCSILWGHVSEDTYGPANYPTFRGTFPLFGLSKVKGRVPLSGNFSKFCKFHLSEQQKMMPILHDIFLQHLH